MSRREEVEKNITEICEDYTDGDGRTEAIRLARTLADEVDALRAEADPDALTICYMQGQASRDRIITDVLAMFCEITCDPSCGITWICRRCQAYARACEIAGRTE